MTALRHEMPNGPSRLAAKGTIRRLARGLYEYPRMHPELGMLSPDIDQVAKALAGKDRICLQPSGAYATNLLGLSEQVPAKVVFLTDGPSRIVKIGRQEIQLRHTTTRNMAAAGRLSGLLSPGRAMTPSSVTSPATRRFKVLSKFDTLPPPAILRNSDQRLS
jgi:hypothetical protein